MADLCRFSHSFCFFIEGTTDIFHCLENVGFHESGKVTNFLIRCRKNRKIKRSLRSQVKIPNSVSCRGLTRDQRAKLLNSRSRGASHFISLSRCLPSYSPACIFETFFLVPEERGMGWHTTCWGWMWVCRPVFIYF